MVFPMQPGRPQRTNAGNSRQQLFRIGFPAQTIQQPELARLDEFR